MSARARFFVASTILIGSIMTLGGLSLSFVLDQPVVTATLLTAEGR